VRERPGRDLSAEATIGRVGAAGEDIHDVATARVT
jgi:hypothetical protein